MIVSSAIKFWHDTPEHSFVWTGKRHSDILHALFTNHINYDKNKSEQGFYTDDNRFLNRYEAKEYAIKCGQITESEYKQLFSEDLWPE